MVLLITCEILEIQHTWPLGLRLRVEDEPTILILDLEEGAEIVRFGGPLPPSALAVGMRVRIEEGTLSGTIRRIEIL